MKLTLKEINGLLNGKCLPSDLIVGETLAEYLVRKFAELEQKLEESQREFRAADATIENLEAKCAALAAEVYDLKHPGTYLPSKRETPALDAFLAEVRAQGVEMLREHPAIKLCSLTHVCDEFAAQIRKGVRS